MATGWDIYLDKSLLALNYMHRGEAKRCICAAMDEFTDLYPDFSPEILNLKGTISISFQGSNYDIPIRIQLLRDFPYKAPLVFVVPTSILDIKPSRYVDANGKVSINELTNWIHHPKHPLHLRKLLRKIKVSFEETPPLFTCQGAQTSAAARWDSYLNEQLVALGFTDREEAKRCIFAVMEEFTELHPESNENHGFSLSGTIPINFEGSSNNIPMRIQLASDFPHQAPFVFVVPTSTMVIRPSRHVDGDGLVHVDQIMWVNSFDSATKFTDLMKMLVNIFEEFPPLYTVDTSPQQIVKKAVAVKRKSTLRKLTKIFQGSLPLNTGSKLQQETTTKRESVKQEDQGQSSKDSKMCKVCLERPYNTVLIPCGHMYLCNQCASTVTKANGSCPICRATIASFHRVFTPE